MVLTVRTIDKMAGINECGLVDTENDDHDHDHDSSVVAADMLISMRCGWIEMRCGWIEEGREEDRDSV